MNLEGIMPEGELGLSGFRCSGKTPCTDPLRIGFFQKCSRSVQCAAGGHNIINDKDVFAGQIEIGLDAHIRLTAGSLSGSTPTLLLVLRFLQKRVEWKAEIIRDRSGQFFTQIKSTPEPSSVGGRYAGDDIWVAVRLVVKGRMRHQHKCLNAADLASIAFVFATM